jgi:hypothetical protein
MTVRPTFQQVVDHLRYAPDRRQHLEALLRIVDSHNPVEIELYRELVLAPVPRGASPDESVDALARKALAYANEHGVPVVDGVRAVTRGEDTQALFKPVRNRAYHLRRDL